MQRHPQTLPYFCKEVLAARSESRAPGICIRWQGTRRKSMLGYHRRRETQPAGNKIGDQVSHDGYTQDILPASYQCALK